MKRLMPIFIVILLSGCGILTAYAPNMLSMIVVAVMGVVVLLGIIYGLIPVLRKQSDQTGAHLLVVLKLRAGDQHDLS